MVRTTLLWMVVAFLAAYAWRDWYKALCGLISLMAVVQHPDFPNSILGIQGFNPWNVLLADVVFAWAFARKAEHLKWDLAPKYVILIGIFFSIIVISYVRMAIDPAGLKLFAQYRGVDALSPLGQFSEYIVNCIKWIIPGLLLYDGCRNESRFRWAVYTILAVYFLLAVQVIRWMPLEMLGSGDELSVRGLKILENEVGFHRVNMSMLLAGAAWAMYAARDLPNHYLAKMAMIGGSGILLFALALTGGRMGLATWAVLAVAFSLWRWRRLILIGPGLMMIAIAIVPAARDRMLQGFSGHEIQTNASIEETQEVEEGEISWYTVTSGRSFAWPFVLEKIAERPIVGYGRDAMIRTGTAAMLLYNYGEEFPHPHNLYLQWILDNGILGAIPVFAMFFLFVRRSLFLFRDTDDLTCVTIGGVTLALLLAFLVAGVGSQTFYPREGAVGMWCAIGLMLRVDKLALAKAAAARVYPAAARAQPA